MPRAHATASVRRRWRNRLRLQNSIVTNSMLQLSSADAPDLTPCKTRLMNPRTREMLSAEETVLSTLVSNRFPSCPQFDFQTTAHALRYG
jgi:hypothetical protein